MIRPETNSGGATLSRRGGGGQLEDKGMVFCKGGDCFGSTCPHFHLGCKLLQPSQGMIQKNANYAFMIYFYSTLYNETDTIRKSVYNYK